jgi:hypothetical protein
MDLLLRHYQNKKSKTNNSVSICELQLYQYDSLIHYIADFSFDYLRYGIKNILTIHHGFTVNLKNGDINTYYQLSNYSVSEGDKGRSKNNRKKNNFDSILALIENGMYKGEKRKDYWGKRYNKSIQDIINILISKIQSESNFNIEKNYQEKCYINPLYDLLVDFHLSKKNIKYHDTVYTTIQQEYPQKKWLKLNDNKFLPSILDSYGIKSKYLIAELNKPQNFDVNIKSLSFLCKLFGDGYVDYLRQTKWHDIVKRNSNFRKFHTLKNDKEKSMMVKVINDWETTNLYKDNFVELVNKLMNLREFIESKNIPCKFNASDSDSVELLLNKFENIKNHFKRGYKTRYSFNEEFINEIESDIIIDNKVFQTKILKTEEDFFTEGFMMKNCMSKQFSKGVVYIYLSMKCNRTKINLEYKKGSLIMSFGKANSPVESYFNPAINEISKKMMKYSNMTWTKEKYEYISK